MDKVKAKAVVNEPFRWENYVLFDRNTVDELWVDHLSTGNRRVLYILGNGFDLRMNSGIRALKKACPTLSVTCLLIRYQGAETNDLNDLEPTANLVELESILEPNTLVEKPIQLYRPGNTRSYVGDTKAVSTIITSWDDISGYSDVILDISSLPRGVYLSLSGKILSLIDEVPSRQKLINYFILATENAKMDALIEEQSLIGRPKFLHGFAIVRNDADTVKPMLWLPMLGERKRVHVAESLDELESQTQKLEICPVLPFPSSDPRRSDNLLAEHRELLFDKLTIDAKDVLYVPERNPYEVYLGLAKTIVRFNRSMGILGGCRAIISPFASKLLSIGAMLTSYELNRYRKQEKIGVGILSTLSDSYELVDELAFTECHQDSEIFVTWIAGEPYTDSSD